MYALELIIDRRRRTELHEILASDLKVASFGVKSNLAGLVITPHTFMP
jgi:hypothetical protein